MSSRPPSLVCGMLVLGAALALSAAPSQETRLTIATGGILNVVNNWGSVTLHHGSSNQIIVNSTPHSNKVEVDASSTSDVRRAEVRTHILPNQKPGNEESKVDFDIIVPSGISVIISTSTAPVILDKVGGDISISSDTGSISVRDVANSYLHIRGITGPILLSNVIGHVEITSSGGSVQLSGVSGPKVIVGTTSGNISYQGDFAGGGSYSLTTHSGTIDVSLPEAASIDLTASSVTGSVENDFPLQAKSHVTFALSPGHAFAGTANSGSSSVELQSFSGKIRVKKR